MFSFVVPRNLPAARLQPESRSISVPDNVSADLPWWRSKRFTLPDTVSRRAIGIVAALAIELLILLLLLTLSWADEPTRAPTSTLTTFDASEPSSAPDPAPPEEQQQPEAAEQVAQPQPSTETEAQPAPQIPSALPRVPRLPSTIPAPPAPTRPEPAPAPSASSTSPPIRAVIRPGANMGPPDTGRRGPPDDEAIGTAPDGSPLYAARWYREPYDSELAGYLSTARGPGWGLIVCKTAPDWRVEECQVLSESPQGSGIARATLAAAWQFQVRPPRLDGNYQVGAWVRIRMTYGSGRGPGQ